MGDTLHYPNLDPGRYSEYMAYQEKLRKEAEEEGRPLFCPDCGEVVDEYDGCACKDKGEE